MIVAVRSRLRGEPRPANASKTEMACGSVDRLAHSRGGPVTLAIVRGAEIGTAFHDFPRNTHSLKPRIMALVTLAAFGIEGCAARPHRAAMRLIPVRRPLPDVSDHVVEPVSIGRKRTNRRSALVAVRGKILDREFALPCVRHDPAARLQLITPGKVRRFKSASRGELPFSLRRNVLLRPGAIRLDIRIGDVDDGMV